MRSFLSQEEETMGRIRVIIAGLTAIMLMGGLLTAQTVSPRVRRVVPRDRLHRQNDYRSYITQLSSELLSEADELSAASYDYFMGWSGEITNQEQNVLFKSEEFTATCRLFHKLVSDQGNYFRSESLRTNLFNAFRYVKSAFKELEAKMFKTGFRDGFSQRRRDGREYFYRQKQSKPSGRWGLRECRRLVDEIENEFKYWHR